MGGHPGWLTQAALARKPDMVAAVLRVIEAGGVASQAGRAWPPAQT